ncbi:MAG: glycosyltransferase, partial [Luteibaculum sp.]
MKILMVAPMPTHPSTAGNRLRILKFAQELIDQGHDVHFMYVALEGEASGELKLFWGEQLHVIPAKPIPIRFIKNKLITLAYKLRLQKFIPERFYRYSIDAWFNNAWLKHFEELNSRENFDAILLSYAWMSKFFEWTKAHQLKVLDTHDRISKRHHEFLKIGAQPQWFSCVKEEEKKGLERADCVVAIQDKEAEFFRKLSSKPVTTVGFPMQAKGLKLDSEPQVLNRLGFFASKNTVNTDAIHWFLKEMWPQLIKEKPDLELLIAGSICSELVANKNCVLLGWVDNPEEFYNQVSATINPSRIGTGLKIKSLESVAFGKPVFSTEHALQGFEIFENKGMIPCTS